MVDIETLDKTDTENLDISKMDKGDTLPEDKVEEKTEAPAEEKTEAPAEETPEETGEEKDSAKAEGKPDQERDDKGRFKEIKVPKNRFDQERLAKEAAEKRAEELERQLAVLPRENIARESIDTTGKIIIPDDLDKAVEAANLIAPEHIELCVDDPFAMLGKIKNAGSIFLGKNVPEALGDYFAGPNHTLPTSGTARFSSPLSVDDFVNKSSFLYYSKEALAAVAPRIADFADREGLHGHARSVMIRYEND